MAFLIILQQKQPFSVSPNSTILKLRFGGRLSLAHGPIVSKQRLQVGVLFLELIYITIALISALQSFPAKATRHCVPGFMHVSRSIIDHQSIILIVGLVESP